MLKLAIKSKKSPPFYSVNDFNCHDKIDHLIKMNINDIRGYKEESREYFNKYLLPERLSNLMLENYGL